VAKALTYMQPLFGKVDANIQLANGDTGVEHHFTATDKKHSARWMRADVLTIATAVHFLPKDQFLALSGSFSQSTSKAFSISFFGTFTSSSSEIRVTEEVGEYCIVLDDGGSTLRDMMQRGGKVESVKREIKGGEPL